MDLIAQGTQANQHVQTAATADSSQLESFLLSALSADDSGPPQVNSGTEQPLTASTPRANLTLTQETQADGTYHQIIPGMSERLYPGFIWCKHHSILIDYVLIFFCLWFFLLWDGF